MVFNPMHSTSTSDRPLWCQELNVAHASQSGREDELKTRQVLSCPRGWMRVSPKEMRKGPEIGLKEEEVRFYEG